MEYRPHHSRKTCSQQGGGSHHPPHDVPYDHRIVDGREAVQFLMRLKELIEEPETLLLEG